MAIGKSGRVVIEIEPELKEALHTAVKMKGMTMKEWFVKCVESDFPDLLNEKKNKN